MTPSEYLQLRKRHEYIKRAKYLIEHHNGKTTQDLIQQMAFKHETGLLPDEYLKTHKK